MFILNSRKNRNLGSAGVEKDGLFVASDPMFVHSVTQPAQCTRINNISEPCNLFTMVPTAPKAIQEI